MKQVTEKVEFKGYTGELLSGRLELPSGDPVAYAIFAHCFTCSKDVHAANRISRGLAERGFGVLRFDFTGLGSSDGDFSNSNFSSNVSDLVNAANFLKDEYSSPQLLIGHSLGGAAVLAAMNRVKTVEAVVTIGAPSDPGHVQNLFKDDVDRILKDGELEVKLAGRDFKIQKQFLEDVRAASVKECLKKSKVSLLVMHSPTDNIVGIENAREIFDAAKHPKSFISLDGADHFLTRAEDSKYAADVISAWAQRYVHLKSN